MSVYLDGEYHGATRLLRFGHKNGSLTSWPEVAALYNTGYVRLVPYGLTYGTSFILGPAYWEDTGTGERYFHDLQISRIDIDTSYIDPMTDLGPVYMTVYARDYQEGYWPAYHLNLKYYLLLQDYAPNNIEMLVQQYYTVENAFNLSLVRQTNHEGFKWVQFSSMYMDNNFHDSDGIQYPVQGGEIVSPDFPSGVHYLNSIREFEAGELYGYGGTEPIVGKERIAASCNHNFRKQHEGTLTG